MLCRSERLSKSLFTEITSFPQNSSIFRNLSFGAYYNEILFKTENNERVNIAQGNSSDSLRKLLQSTQTFYV